MTNPVLAPDVRLQLCLPDWGLAEQTSEGDALWLKHKINISEAKSSWAVYLGLHTRILRNISYSKDILCCLWKLSSKFNISRILSNRNLIYLRQRIFCKSKFINNLINSPAPMPHRPSLSSSVCASIVWSQFSVSCVSSRLYLGTSMFMFNRSSIYFI